MSFISLQFLVFFMVITLSYYRLLDQRSRVVLLLAASCYFYMCFVPKYILILGTMILIDYLAAFLPGKLKANPSQRRPEDTGSLKNRPLKRLFTKKGYFALRNPRIRAARTLTFTFGEIVT